MVVRQSQYLAHVEQLDVRGVPLELVLEEVFVEVEVPVVEPEPSGLVDLVCWNQDGFCFVGYVLYSSSSSQVAWCLIVTAGGFILFCSISPLRLDGWTDETTLGGGRERGAYSSGSPDCSVSR